ncbi:MAG: anhydro-N-acetylmuramic acid kinase [Pseudoflavonifractor sp.]
MLQELKRKSVRRVVGLMSGTSVDGVDAALTEISGDGEHPKVKLLAFENRPFPDRIRAQIFELFDPKTATVDKVGYMNFLLGEVYAEAVLSVISAAGLTPGDVDLVGSHGQTIWHAPEICSRDGYEIRSTVQIGEGAVIARRTGLPTVSDFRVADMAAGGQAAPLVPFSEYLLYRRENETILLQNLGGIGNITVLPAGGGPEDVFAFDTGPGNMIIDAVVSALTEGRQTYDAGGRLAAGGKVHPGLLAYLQGHEYYRRPLPKSTGRELFGTQYTAGVLAWARANGVADADLIATVTYLTAWSVGDAYERYIAPICKASTLVIGGGGSYNATLMENLATVFSLYSVRVCTQEDLGENSDAKEAVAFALLADYNIRERPNNLPGVTGAKGPAILGKLSLP